MDYASIIKDRVSTPELFAFYGFKRNRGGFVNCPFHQEKTGSMKVYDGKKGYHCFGGCGAHGDILDFVQNYFGLSFQEALHKINDDFHLMLPLDGEVDRQKMKQLQIEAEKRRKEQKAKQSFHDRLRESHTGALMEYIRLERQKEHHRPASIDEYPDKEFFEALANISRAEHTLDNAEIRLNVFELAQRGEGG